ncbi:hypothetical protein V8D89_002172 [Ganoderma adspersum]
MDSTFNDLHDVLSPAPSRAAHRRPPLKRAHASHNLFPHLPPIQTRCASPADIDTITLADGAARAADGGPLDLGDHHSKVDLSPMCPPSPPSPISSSSESSTSSLAIPHEADDWERFHDGFAPPPTSAPPQIHPWPPTPNPNIPPRLPPQERDSYHGWSGNSLFEMKRFWYTRHRTWWDYDEHCRHLHNYLTSASSSEGDLDATMYYPPSPALLPSRLTLWSGPNGLSFDTERISMDVLALPRVSRLQVHSPWAPVFPRFGDIEDLRDPSCELLDRMFLNFPPYAISKFLYIEQVAAQERDARPRHHTRPHSPPTPPSPIASVDAPWSPGSVYSEDGRGFAEVSTMATSSTMSLASRAPGLYGGLRWLERWELLKQRLFPQSISPPSTASSASPLLSSVESDPALSSFPVHLPPRPGTPLPDDEQNRVPFLAHLADAHSDDQPGESTSHDDSLGVCAGPVDPGGPTSPPEVHAPLPVSECDGSSSNDDADPVVRLPSSPSHPPRTYVARVAADAHNAHSPHPAQRTLADELSAALGDAGVQFSIAPPSAVAQVSSRFSFFAEESGFDGFELEDIESGFDVGPISMVSAGTTSVHVEAVLC